MHKGVILLVKANDKEEAIDRANSFIGGYENDVWDWYVIGGRWSGLLNPKSKEFYEKADLLFKERYEDSQFVSTNMIKEQAEALETIWNELGGVGVNLYKRNQYDSDGSDDDCMPLVDCIERVKEWTKDMSAEADKYWDKMVVSREDDKGSTMSGYYARRFADCVYDDFCFESNVYDTEQYSNDTGYALANPDNYYAVVVDMHN